MAHPCCLCGAPCDCQRISDGLDFRTPDSCKSCGCDGADFDDDDDDDFLFTDDEDELIRLPDGGLYDQENDVTHYP